LSDACTPNVHDMITTHVSDSISTEVLQWLFMMAVTVKAELNAEPVSWSVNAVDNS